MDITLPEPIPNVPKLTYAVRIKKLDHGYAAAVLGWSDCQAIGATREGAIANLRQQIIEQIQQSEVISLEIDNPNYQHPWMAFAGMFADDPDFESVQADIATYRQEIDKKAGNR
jgi:predicted RNase H-like HicB family nuclease